MPKSDRGGKRENSDEKLLNYYKSLNKLHKERLKKYLLKLTLQEKLYKML